MSSELEEVMYDEDPTGLQELLERGDVDPSEIGNWSLRHAEDNDLQEMAKILKKDPRVRNYENFIKSIKDGNFEKVGEYHSKLTGIIDEQSTNYPLLLARNAGFDEIEQFLLEDPRVQLQEKAYDNAYPREIAELLKIDIVMADPGTRDLLMKKEEYREVYNEELEDRIRKKGVLDAAIGLRGLQTSKGRLPVHVVEEIINRAYDTRGTLGLTEVIPRIQNIFYRN